MGPDTCFHEADEQVLGAAALGVDAQRQAGGDGCRRFLAPARERGE